MVCPYCYSPQARRSRRRNLVDYLAALAGVWPWRCRVCQSRFHAGKVPFRLAKYAHCPKCGNFEPKRISGDRVQGALSGVWQRLGLPAYRCDPCRHRFFTRRPLANLTPRVFPRPGRVEKTEVTSDTLFR